MRMLRQSLWFKVLAHKYGVEGGLIKSSGRNASKCWTDLNNLGNEGTGFRRNWFMDSIAKSVGCGSDTLFWHEPWVEGGLLSTRFNRLLNLTDKKMARVANLGFWEGDHWIWKWCWRRKFFQWETDLSMSLNNY